jgi:molecular chaperone GrpE (heat shock protein)
MGTNKTYEERIKAQKDIMEKAAAKIKELEEAAAKKEEEKKQKKIESILKDIEKALSDSPILSATRNQKSISRFWN